MTSRLGTGKSLTFFYSVGRYDNSIPESVLSSPWIVLEIQAQIYESEAPGALFFDQMEVLYFMYIRYSYNKLVREDMKIARNVICKKKNYKNQIFTENIL